MKKLSLFVFLILIFIQDNLAANIKLKIIENINKIDTLKFNFSQFSFNIEEKGTCYLKRPYFLKCLYEDKKQKQLIINKRSLVIYHERYKKIYYYPLSRSYFLEILDKNKFSKIIMDGNLSSSEGIIQIKFFTEKKGNIIFYFDGDKFDLIGWVINDINNNSTNFKILNLNKNIKIEKKIFNIPAIN